VEPKLNRWRVALLAEGLIRPKRQGGKGAWRSEEIVSLIGLYQILDVLCAAEMVLVILSAAGRPANLEILVARWLHRPYLDRSTGNWVTRSGEAHASNAEETNDRAFPRGDWRVATGSSPGEGMANLGAFRRLLPAVREKGSCLHIARSRHRMCLRIQAASVKLPEEQIPAKLLLESEKSGRCSVGCGLRSWAQCSLAVRILRPPEFRSRAKRSWLPRLNFQSDVELHGSREPRPLVYHSDSILPPHQPSAPFPVLRAIAIHVWPCSCGPDESQCPFRRVFVDLPRGQLLFEPEALSRFLCG
jgi:hypothetical protein